MSSAPRCEREASDAALLDIVERASSLVERIRQVSHERRHRGLAHHSAEAPAESETIDARLDTWCRMSAGGDRAAFLRRLAWDGLDPASARRVLAGGVVDPAAGLPEWAEIVREVISTSGQPAQLVRPRDEPESADPVPFEQFVSLFMEPARRRLAVATRGAPIAEPIASALDRDLRFALSRCAGPTLYFEFTLRRAQREPSLDWLVAIASPIESHEIYDDFVRRLRGSGLLAFFMKYPVLARLLGTIVILRTDAAAEFIHRLATDEEILRREFADGGDIGSVAALQTGLSDPHRGQRRVFAVTFSSGLKVVYKPRDLGSEEQFNRLLQWLDDRGAAPSFKPLRIVARGAYGWAEFAEQRECADDAAVARYYRRLGMLLCVLYALDCTDCHFENLIASGEFPLLVDAETLLQHRPRYDGAGVTAAQRLALDELSRSVLRVGLLPWWQASPDGSTAVDVGGVTGGGAQESGVTVWRWFHVNTDGMVMERAPAAFAAAANIPLLEGKPIAADAHAAELADGFESMYAFLIDQRDALLSDCEPLQALQSQRVRWVHRPTQSYGVLLEEARQPRYMRDGVDRGLLFERLAPSMTESPDKPDLWPLLADECEALEQGDVPLFVSYAATDALELSDGGQVARAFVAPSADVARARLRQLNEDDLQLQLEFIRSALVSVRTSAATEEECESPREPLHARALIEAAVAIRDEILSRAITAPDGSVTWVGPQAVGASERHRLEPVGDGLYDGVTGIALFLAAVASVTGNAEDRSWALRAVAPVVAYIRECPAVLTRSGIGLASGVAGIAYGLGRIGSLLDEPECLRAASAAAALLTAERIAEDRRFDVLAGAAGSLLGVLAVHAATGDAGALSNAIGCGRHLIDSRVPSSLGPRAWRTVAGRQLTGFAHGAAGIGYALARLAAETGEARFLDAARESADYEDALFSPQCGNWPDLRSDPPTFAVKWCHGAPGIGLARLGQIGVLDSPQLRRDIDAAIDSVRERVAPTHHLCCGAMGHVDLLLEAGRALNRPELTRKAVAIGTAVVQRSRSEGRYRTPGQLPRTILDPSLFSGIAGIGYELLRTAAPSSVRSVLLFETE